MDRILPCRTGWMKDYRGSTGDALTGKSAWIREHGSGHEIDNFLVSGARVFGYVDFRGEMNLGRIDPAAEGQGSLDNVLLVCCAPHPRGGVWVVGWYEDATVCAAQRTSPNLKKRVDPEKPSKPCAWSITAEAKDVCLLPMDMRSLRVTRAFALRSYVRYLDAPASKAAAFRKALNAYVAGGWKKGKGNAGDKGEYQQDVEKRLRVEKVAMKTG